MASGSRSTSGTDRPGFLRVGRIVRPHGLRGEVVIESDSDFGAERFAQGRVLRVGEIDRLVLTSRPQGDRWIVRFQDVGGVEKAETLRDLPVEVDEAVARAILSEGQVFVHDLIGAEVVTVSGQVVGQVSRVYTGAGQDLLGVDGPRGEVLVPVVDEICREVDVAARRVVIDPPEGLLEANAASDGPMRSGA